MGAGARLRMAHPLLRVRAAGSFIQGRLPAGCAMCEQGAKMVVFVTGVCHYKCFYCPISAEKRMNASTWVNEKRIDADDFEAMGEEARAMDAKGTGLTGGDPMYDPERTLRYIRYLKETFGPKHHIHLYTQIPFDPKWLAELESAGLDELRFHTPDEVWPDVDAHPKFATLYRRAMETSMTVGIEIPCIPGSQDQMESLVRWADGVGMKFVNVNEMEFSETNYAALLGRGYRIKDDVTSRAMDSEEVAKAVMERVYGGDNPVAISFHFCSSPYKDAIQLRERLKRRAAIVKRPFEALTDDATLMRGVIECPDPEGLLDEIVESFEVPRDLLAVVDGKLYLEPELLEEIAEDVPYPCYLSEVYPTADELEVERTPLNGLPGLPE